MATENIGEKIYTWATDLFPINRSLTGPGVRKTLAYLKELLPNLTLHEVPSGTQAFDWQVPDEWEVRQAYIENEQGQRIVDFQDNNLHVLGYCEPVDKWLSLEDLDKHLYSLEDQPDAIPYVTSYYQRRWGFCLTHQQRQSLAKGQYHVVVDSDLKKGVLNYAELIIPGKEEKEVLLSTYVCHPSMGNNELSGPTVTTALAQWLLSLPERRYTYRILFLPETIGSIVYLSKHHKELKEKMVAGFVVTCVGDNDDYSYMPSRTGETLADKVAKHVLNTQVESYTSYSFLERGSDERQYCSPLIDLPVASVMRTKYGAYPEYHTSLDDLSFISPEGLQGGYEALQKCLMVLEMNLRYKATIACEPQLGKRGLYPTIGQKNKSEQVRLTKNILAYADGEIGLIEMAEICNVSVFHCVKPIKKLVNSGLLEQL